MKLSWTNELYKVYENNCKKDDEKNILLPLSHSTAKAQIEVTLSESGRFITSEKIDQSDSLTIIPVTEDSGSRGAGINPHPFFDKLIYVAGDYSRYVTDKNGESEQYFKTYIKQLQEWSDSKYPHPAVKAVLEYLKKETLIQDLVKSHSLCLDEHSGKLKEKEKILGIAQEDCFVRFRIQYSDIQKESRTWMDSSLQDNFNTYYQGLLENHQLCYATGEISSCTYKHPSKIRNGGDKAKLISTNDESGFTYRGRFASKEEAVSIGYNFSQKMHNALKWLIEKQGVPIGSMMLLVWASNLQPLPNILRNFTDSDEDEVCEDVWEDNWDEEEDVLEEQFFSDTMPIFKSKIKKAIWKSDGGKSLYTEMNPDLKVMIMVLDAATTGRLSMNLYEEMSLTVFYENLEKWYYDTAWIRFNGKKKINEINSFSLYEIADFAYGTEQNTTKTSAKISNTHVDFAYGTEKDKIIKCKPEIKSKTILRLIPCVIEGRDVPSDIVMNLFHKACAPTAYKSTYNWRKVLEAACGLIRKNTIEKKGECQMALDKTCKERDYLYGRLLAIAEVAEKSTYDKSDEVRMTNASRYFEAFSNRPYQTWAVIYERLIPYLKKMEIGKRSYYEMLFAEVNNLFEKEDFQDNTKLKPMFLLAYYCQLSDLYTKKNNKKNDFEEENK